MSEPTWSSDNDISHNRNSCICTYLRPNHMSKSTGTVKWFNTEKGYGFILNEEGEDVMVHYRSILMEGFKNLREGQTVLFTQVKSEKGWQAAEVELVTESDSA